MSYVRTPEHRAFLSEQMKQNRPWEKTKGPKTPEGKARSAMRGYKGGQRQALRELAKVLKEHLESLEQISDCH